MIKLTIIVLFLLLVTAITYVKLWRKTVHGNGNDVLLKRSTENYVGITLSGSFNVELVDGIAGNLILNGEENLLKHITTEVINKKLYLSVEKGYKLKPSLRRKDIQLTVPVEQLNSIKISGSGNIVSKKTLRSQGFITRIIGSGYISSNLEVETLSTNITGSGYLNFSGKAKNFMASSAGSCNINAYNLEAEVADLSLSGSGTMMVTVSNKLKARVSGSGYIHYQGNPKNVDFETYGPGKVFKE